MVLSSATEATNYIMVTQPAAVEARVEMGVTRIRAILSAPDASPTGQWFEDRLLAGLHLTSRSSNVLYEQANRSDGGVDHHR